MKVSILKYSITGFIVAVLSVLALLAVRPVYTSIRAEMRRIQENLFFRIEETFGVRLEYASMSPSILSSIYLRNLTAKDAVTGDPLLEINRVYFRYNLLKIITQDWDSAFQELVLDGGRIVFDNERNSRVREKIAAFIRSRPEPAADTDSAGSSFAISTPFSVSIRNVTASWFDDTIAGSLAVRRGTIEFQDGDIVTDIRGIAAAGSPLLPQLKTVSTSFGISGSVSSSFDRSSLQITLHSLANPDFSVSRVGFLLSLADSVITLDLIQNLLPFQLSAYWNLNTHEFAAQLDAEDFEPASLVTLTGSLTGGGDLLAKLKGSLLSGFYQVSGNTETKDLRYSGNGSVSLTEQLLPGGLSARFSVDGSTSAVTVHHFSAQTLKGSAPYIDLFAEGSFDFASRTPEGTIRLNRFVLPSGNTIEAEIYVDPLDNGFMVFIPQLFLGEQVYTATQLSVFPAESSIDIQFETYDYSHIETGAPGVLKIDGSLLTGDSPFAQSYISLEGFFPETAVKTAFFFLDTETRENSAALIDMIAPYAISNEIYISTDFSSFLFNAPHMIMVNTQKDGNSLVFSLSGNDTGGTFTVEDMLFEGQNMRGTFNLLIGPQFTDFLVNADIIVNSLPYTFMGTIVPGSYVSVTGDYGLDLSINLNEDQMVSGSVFLSGLPVPIGGLLSSFLPTLSIDSEFTFNSPEEWEVILRRFEIADASGALTINPHAAFSGRLDRYGLFFDTITYTDTGSSLLGSGGINWDLSSGTPDNINVNVDMANPVTPEKYNLSLNLSNPDGVPFSSLEFLKGLYISLRLDLAQFPFSRFMERQRADDYVNGSVTCLGTLDSLYLSVNIDRGSVSLQTLPLLFSGQLVLEDRELSLLNTVVSYRNQHISDFNGSFSIDYFFGEITAAYNGSLGDYTLAAPLRLSVFPDMTYQTPVPQEMADMFGLKPTMPSGFTINLTVGQPSMDNAPVLEEMRFQIRRTPGRTEFSGFRDQAISGYLLDTGALALSAKEPLPFRFDAAGSLEGPEMAISVDNIYAELAAFSRLIRFPFFALDSGTVTGALRLGGLLTDPEFNGTLEAAAFVCSVPDFVTEPIGPTDITIRAEYNRIYIEPVPVTVRRGRVMFDLELLFDRWRFDHLTMNIRPENQTLLDAKAVIPMMSFTGSASPSLFIQVTPDETQVIGSIYVQDADGVFSFVQEVSPGSADTNTHVDLTIHIGQHVQMSHSAQPVIRALIIPDAPLSVTVDTALNAFQVNGSLTLRGGEVSLFNRNFYLREGHIDLNLNENMIDPIITIRAETRERDHDGNPVRIILSADNQLFSQFSPRFTSDPVKTQEEIMALFGQAVLGDSDNILIDIASIGMDALTHILVVRNFEDRLRRMLNLDVFSLRITAPSSLLTNWLMRTNSANNSAENNDSTGNYVDISSVYIGKYLGSSIYLEGMLDIYHDSSLDSPILGGLGFRPEFGLEMASPFANLRWALSPDMTDILGVSNFVGGSSITLSWKFTF